MNRRALFLALALVLTSRPGAAQLVNEGVLLGGGSPLTTLDASGRYFVMFASPPGQAERDMVTSHGATILWSYSVVPAFAIYAPSTAITDAIKQDPRVRYVDPDKVVYALGDENNPEISDASNDQSLAGNATHDILKAWIQQLDDDRIQFLVKLRDLSAVNPTTGEGLTPNAIWKFVFSLQQPGHAAPDQYFVQMRTPETGPPLFQWGFISGTTSTTGGTADGGQILPSQGTITITNSASKFVGAPNQNGVPTSGDVLASPFAQTQQLVGTTTTGGLLAQLDRAPNSGGGRSYTVIAFPVSPKTLDFGSLTLGSAKTLSVMVANPGSTSLVVSSVQSSNTEYSVTPTSATIAPSSSQTFAVTFFPSALGPQLGTLLFYNSYTSWPGTVALKATAYSPTAGESTPWGVVAVKAPLVWETTTGRSVKVAVLDTGIDSLHYELDDRYRGGYNFVAKTPYPWDGHSHGTHVSGTIAAELNGTGLMGVSHEVELYALKVLSDAGSGFFSDVYAAIDWCLQNGIHVANMSLGGRVYDPTGEEVFLNASSAGLLSVAAAGNGVNGTGTPQINYPAAYQGVMAIGAIGRDRVRAAFSDFGPDLELVAPGVDVRSTVPRGRGRESNVIHGSSSLEANPLEFAALTPAGGTTAQAINCGKGLSPADFPPQVGGEIALIQRGDSTFASKVQKAQDAGAIAVIIYNNAPGNFNGTLGTARDDARNRDWVPAVSLSQEDGQALVAAGSSTVTVLNDISDFAKFQGTSMASPHAAAVAALVKGANPQLSNAQIRTILNSTASDLGLPGFDPEYGNGLVDAETAVQRAQATQGDIKEGTISPSNRSVTWTGGPFTAVTADPALCTSLTCDNFTLTVDVPPTFYQANPSYEIRVHVSWDTLFDDINDFDVYVYDSEGNLVNSGTQGNTKFEDVNLDQLSSGTYQVQVVAFATVDARYSGAVALGPPLPDQIRGGKYKQGRFTFSQPKALLGPDGLIFGVQDVEPRAAYDALGNIYVAAIQGTPAGTDVWKSLDGGNTFTYLGQPDGAQAASATVGRTPGAGGGDQDIAIGSSGRVYVCSLFGIRVPMTVTMCSSSNGGATWLVNPMSQDIPLVDRQWIAAAGDSVVYLTFKQLGALLVGTTSIFVMKSTDGGLTFPQVTQVTTPEIGVQPGFQGNIAVDRGTGNVYTVFVGHPGNSIYVARSTDGGTSFILKLVHQGADGLSYENVFPILAVDRGGNVHVVYSDGRNVYLASSADQGATWTVPLRVNNGVETKTALAPWIDAGDAGKVDITWWATSSTSSLASDATWKVYFAQVQNTFARTPTVMLNAATPVFHTGPICVHGTGCAEGTRDLAEYASTTVYLDGRAMIVYPDDQQTEAPLTYFTKQTDGPTVLSSHANNGLAAASGTGSGPAVPTHYGLHQNYPNPVGTQTTIRYQLPVAGHVAVRLYNVLGQEVATLVDEQQNAGFRSVVLDASRLANGLYFYKVIAGTFVDVRRLVILR